MLKFFSFSGRIRRKDYVIGSLLVGILYLIGEESVDRTENVSILSILIVLAIVTGWLGLSLAARRLHDVGMSGWYCLINFIPFVNLAFGLFLMLRDGTVGENRYGDDPKGRDPIDFNTWRSDMLK